MSITSIKAMEDAVEVGMHPWQQQVNSMSASSGQALTTEEIRPRYKAKQVPEFCFVVRTFWGHGGEGDHGLARLIRSLQRQSVQNWEAVLVVADSRPFKDLHHILQDVDDPRVWVFAEWVS